MRWVEQEFRLKSRKRGKDHKPGRGVAVCTGGLLLPSCHQGTLLAPGMRHLGMGQGFLAAPHRVTISPCVTACCDSPWTCPQAEAHGPGDSRIAVPHPTSQRAPHRVQCGRVKLFLPPANHRPCLGSFVGCGDIPPFNHSFT